MRLEGNGKIYGNKGLADSAFCAHHSYYFTVHKFIPEYPLNFTG
jgi:hypothetical protein